MNCFRYWESGLSVECAWFFSATRANCSKPDAAVLAGVFHARHGEHARHRVGAEVPFGARDRAGSAFRSEPPGRSFAGHFRRQQAGLAHLLDTDRERDVGVAGPDREARGAQRGGPGRTRVRDVVDGDSRLADLLEQLLADALVRVEDGAGRECPDVGHAQLRVRERAEGRVAREVEQVAVGKAPERCHGHADEPDGIPHVVHLVRLLQASRLLTSSPAAILAA